MTRPDTSHAHWLLSDDIRGGALSPSQSVLGFKHGLDVAPSLGAAVREELRLPDAM